MCTAVKNLDTEMPLNKALLRTIEGVSPIVCREIEYKVMEGATNRIEGVLFDRLAVEIEKLKSVCSDVRVSLLWFIVRTASLWTSAL